MSAQQKTLSELIEENDEMLNTILKTIDEVVETSQKICSELREINGLCSSIESPDYEKR